MSFCALYKTNEEMKIERNVCFTRFYTRPKSFNDIYIYALEDYNMFKGTNKLFFNNTEIEEYLNSFLQMGFNFSYSYINKIDVDFVKSGGWELHIPSQENSVLSTMIITNAFRYIYEKGFQNIIKYYLILKNDENNKVSNWNKFMISHYSDEYWLTHCIQYDRQKVTKMLTDDEFKSKILNYNKQTYGTDSIPKTDYSISDHFQLKDDFKNNIKNVYSYFNLPN